MTQAQKGGSPGSSESIATRLAPAPSLETKTTIVASCKDEESDPAVIVPLNQAINDRLVEAHRTRDLVGDLTTEERGVLGLLEQNERRTSAYAEQLGITHLSPAEQRREVKRVKDRLKKRIERSAKT